MRSIAVCRACGVADLTPLLSLGELHISNFIDNLEQDTLSKAPLELVLCDIASGGCGLLQLRHTVPQDQLYRNYWYRSGMNRTMTEELRHIAATLESLVQFKDGDFIIDIGANDGTLLRSFTFPGLNLVGFEPAKNLAVYNREGTTKIFDDFFNFDTWQSGFGDHKAKAITAIAMFYDLDDPNAFLRDIVRSLDEEGIFIVQMAYLPSVLERNAFDGICHEHLAYYSLTSFEKLLQRNNLEIFDAELRDINEGSVRFYIRRKNGGRGFRVPSTAPRRLDYLRNYEKKSALHSREAYDEFVRRVYDIRNKVTSFIQGEVERGKKVYVYGASTKGNTLLQFFALDDALITAAAERNPAKWGKKTVGTNIPIISEEEARAARPDYFLVLPWHFLKEFREREAEYLARGGKFIVPLPEFTIIEK